MDDEDKAVAGCALTAFALPIFLGCGVLGFLAWMIYDLVHWLVSK